jgi:hypothetical protein
MWRGRGCGLCTRRIIRGGRCPALLSLSPLLGRPRRVPARLPGNFGVRITSLREVSGPPLRELLLAQKKVTKEKSLTILPNVEVEKSSPLLTTEPIVPAPSLSLAAGAASYSLSAGWCANKGLVNQEYEAAQRPSLGVTGSTTDMRYPVVSSVPLRCLAKWKLSSGRLLW